MVAEWLNLRPHSKVVGSIPGSTGLCGVCMFLPVSGWVSSGVSGFPCHHKHALCECECECVYPGSINK